MNVEMKREHNEGRRKTNQTKSSKNQKNMIE